MIPVHLFHSRQFLSTNNKLDCVIVLMLNALVTKKLYGQVQVITDDYGRHLIETLNIPYDQVHRKLELDRGDYSMLDIKMIAFKELASLVPGFLYIDHTLGIQEAIPSRPFIVYEEVQSTLSGKMLADTFKEKGIGLYFDYAHEPLHFFDLSVFRCTDASVIHAFYEAYFTSLYKNMYLRPQLDEMMMEFFYKLIYQNYCFETLNNFGQLPKIYKHKGTKVLQSEQGLLVRTHSDYSPLMEYAFAHYPKEFSQLIHNYKNH